MRPLNCSEVDESSNCTGAMILLTFWQLPEIDDRQPVKIRRSVFQFLDQIQRRNTSFFIEGLDSSFHFGIILVSTFPHNLNQWRGRKVCRTDLKVYPVGSRLDHRVSDEQKSPLKLDFRV